MRKTCRTEEGIEEEIEETVAKRGKACYIMCIGNEALPRAMALNRMAC